MKKVILMNFLLIFMLSLLSSCSDSQSNNACKDVEYGDSFKIEEGKKYCFPDGNNFQVLELLNQFCPCGMACIWEGEMILHYEAEIDGNIFNDNVGSAPFSTSNNLGTEDYKILLSDIKFVTDCTNSNPSPAIESAVAVVTKL